MFGVTAWELLTNGDRPYFGISDDDAVIAHVTAGGRLEPPDEHAEIWAAVERCLGHRPADRPTFAELGVGLGDCPNPAPQVYTLFARMWCACCMSFTRAVRATHCLVGFIQRVGGFIQKRQS